MPVTTYNLTGDFNTVLGGETRSISATLHTNSDDGSWVNETDLKIVLGGAVLPLTDAKTFTVALPTSTGTGLQYEVRVRYTDLSVQEVKQWESGWFSLTANGNLATLAADSSLRVNLSMATQLAGRIDGYNDHGSVSGSVTFSGPNASHWFDATGPTTITLDGYAEGQVVTLICFSGSDNVILADSPDAELSDGLAWSAMLARGAWVSGGGSTGPTDTTPPTAITDLSATGGAGEIVANWADQSDADSTVHYRYRAWLTSGGATGAWTNTDTSGATITGLTAGAYTVEAYSYSAGGSTTPDTATATVTAPAGWNAFVSDSFTGSDGTLAGHVPQLTPNSAAWTTGTAPDILAIEGNRVSQPDTSYNPGGVLAIPSHTASLGLFADLDLNPIGDSTQPSLSLIMKSPSNNEDLTLKAARQSDGTVTLSATAGNGGGTITLTGTTTGHADTARFGFRWRSDRSISVLVNGVQVATATTAVPTYPRDFTEVRIGTEYFKASYFDNFTVEDYT